MFTFDMASARAADMVRNSANAKGGVAPGDFRAGNGGVGNVVYIGVKISIDVVAVIGSNRDNQSMDLDEHSSWSSDLENEMNMQHHPNTKTYDEIDRLIHQITGERNWTNKERKNEEIDFLLIRIEPWQGWTVNDAKETNKTNCSWCMVAAKINIGQGQRTVISTTLLLSRNVSGNTIQAQSSLEQIASLFKSVGFQNMITHPFSTTEDLKLCLTQSIAPGTRKLFAIAYYLTSDTNGSGHIAMYKVWKTTNGTLKTTLVDFQLQPDDSLRNQHDFYPNFGGHLFYDYNQLRKFGRKRRNVNFSFALTSDPKVFTGKVILKPNEWIDINAMITSLKAINNSSHYYEGVRLANHFQYVRVQSAAKCFEECQKNDECEAITFRPVNNDGCHFYRKGQYVAGHDSEWVSISRNIIKI